jgi:hypothetical protein
MNRAPTRAIFIGAATYPPVCPNAPTVRVPAFQAVSDNDWYRSIQVQAVDRGADPQMIGVKRDLDRQPSDNSRSLWWMLAT